MHKSPGMCVKPEHSFQKWALSFSLAEVRLVFAAAVNSRTADVPLLLRF